MKVIVNAKELLAAAKIAYKSDKPNLQTVKIDCDDTRYTITATDSYKLVQFANTTSERDNGVVLIDSNFIKSNVKASDNSVLIETENDLINVKIYAKITAVLRCEIQTKQKEIRFPNTKQILETKPAETINTCAFNAAQMSEMCDAIKTAYGKNAFFNMQFTGTIRPAIFTSENKNGYFKGVLMPVRK